MIHAYTTSTGQLAIRRRNQTAEFYAFVHGFGLKVDPNDLCPIAITFTRQGRPEAVAIVRNRNETLEEFNYPTLMVTAAKVHQLVETAQARKTRGIMIAGMADGAMLTWEVVNRDGTYHLHDTWNSETMADCLRSGLVVRENMYFPLDAATVIPATVLI